jgi:AraC-like DNA-binding protein
VLGFYESVSTGFDFKGAEVTIKAIRSIEDVEESAASGLIVPTQMSTVPVVGSICFAEVLGGVLIHGQYTGDVRVSGPLSETAVTLGIMIGGSQAKVNGQTITPGGIGLFPAGFEHEAIYEGGLDYLLFTVDRTRIFKAARREGLRLQKAALDLPLIGDLPQDRSERMRSRARQMVEVLRAKPDVASHPVAGKALSDELLSLYLRNAREVGFCETESRSDFQGGASLVRLAEDWLCANLDNNVSIEHLSEALGYSQRRLYRAFQSELNMSPGRYLKLYRFSRARQQLAAAEPERTTVTEIGLRWGFWELGRFAGEYRTMFGELPSQTLQKQKSA